jgi:hypothetical protein
MLRNLLAMSLCCAVTPVAFADEPPVQVPVQLAMFHGATAGACLQSPADPAAFDYKLQQAQCLTVGDAQMFAFESDVRGGYRIRNVQSNACVDVLTFSPAGTPVVGLPCNGQDNQRWQVAYAEGNPSVAMIRSEMSQLCLGFADGVAVQANCDLAMGIGPEWVVSRQAARAPDGALALRSLHNGECLSLDDMPASIACNKNGDNSLRFGPMDLAASTFRFHGRTDGTCLVQTGDVLAFDVCITGSNAHWRLVETAWDAQAPNGEKTVRWQVQNLASNQCLRAGANGAPVAMQACDASDNVLWHLARY